MKLSRSGAGRQRADPRPNLARRSRGVKAPRDARSGERSRHRQPFQRWLRILVGVAALVVAGWGAVAALEAARPSLSEWFAVQHVRVTGITQVTRDEVLERLDLRPGQTLLSLDSEGLVARLKAHAWIKDVSVRRIPFHTLAVQITERQAVAVLKTPSLDLLLDHEGHVLSVVEDVDELEVPVLVGIDPMSLMRGDEHSRHAVRAGIELASLMEEAFPGRPEVHAGNPSNLIASIGGFRFLLGPSPFAEKWDLYRRIRPTLQPAGEAESGAGRSEIDLRYPNKVIVRERG